MAKNRFNIYLPDDDAARLREAVKRSGAEGEYPFIRDAILREVERQLRAGEAPVSVLAAPAPDAEQPARTPKTPPWMPSDIANELRGLTKAIERLTQSDTQNRNVQERLIASHQALSRTILEQM